MRGAGTPIVILGERHEVAGVYFDPIAGRYDHRVMVTTCGKRYIPVQGRVRHERRCPTC